MGKLAFVAGLAALSTYGIWQILKLLMPRLFRPAHRPPTPLPETLSGSAEDVRFEVDQTPVRGWLVRPAGAPRAVILLAHGWGSESGRMARFVPPLLAHGFACLLIDLRGHGRSGPVRTYNAVRVLQDLAAARDWIGADPRLSELPAAVAGFSFGGMGALLSAARDRRWHAAAGIASPRGALSALELYFRVRGLPVSLLATPVRFGFRRVYGIDPAALEIPANLRGAEVPILVVHGTGDPIVPLEHGREIADAVPQPFRSTLWVEGAGHGSVLERPEVSAGLSAFFHRVLPPC